MSIDWPAGWDRTDEHESTTRFDTPRRKCIQDIEAEMRRLGVDDWSLSTDADHQSRKPNYPYKESNARDPGAVLRWTIDGDQFAVACDHWDELRDNLRTIYYYVREKRKMSSRPVTTGEDEFSNLRLPSGEEEAAPHEILGVRPDASAAEIKSAFRSQASDAHPDSGGSREAMIALKNARDEML